MFRKFLLILVFSATFAIVAVPPSATQAAGLRESILSETEDVAKKTFKTEGDAEGAVLATINNGINVVLGVLGILATIMILYAGFLWLTAGGNTDQVGKAKKIIKQAIIGLIIISLAYGIVGFVFNIFEPEAPKTQAPTQQAPTK